MGDYVPLSPSYHVSEDDVILLGDRVTAAVVFASFDGFLEPENGNEVYCIT